MSLCINSTKITFTGSRADDGGVPEELTLVITKYCVDPSPLYNVNPFDARYDSDFDFAPFSDGAYKVQFYGGVSGLLEEKDILVKFHAENEIGRIAKEYVQKLQCNQCIDKMYEYKKSLLYMAESYFLCGENCIAENYLEKVIEDDCGNKIKGCGCN